MLQSEIMHSIGRTRICRITCCMSLAISLRIITGEYAWQDHDFDADELEFEQARHSRAVFPGQVS